MVVSCGAKILDNREIPQHPGYDRSISKTSGTPLILSSCSYFYTVKAAEKNLIVIVGPTAVGKTAVAVKVAEYFHTEILSADSRQFYRELTIGTAKPSKEELQQIKHHFIDSHSITEKYDAAQYARDARELLLRLFMELDQVVVCGGSGLYIKALLEGFDDIPDVPDEIRYQISQRYREQGITYLQQALRELDPEGMTRIDSQNPARLMRALEVVMGTGQPIASFQQGEKHMLPYRVIKIGLELEREELYQRIDERMDKMIEAGLFEEAKQLYHFRQHNALQTVGYQEIFDYLDGQYDYAEAIRLLKRNSRRYAKRQLTWFRRDAEINWFNPANIDGIIAFINQC